MIRLLVVADDFTGALDTGVQFAKHGIKTMVKTGADMAFHDLDMETEVLSVDVRTRHSDADEAYQVVFRLIREAADRGVRHIYKKTDSVLRGNIGAELRAAMDAAEHERLMFVPAYPAQGRTTKGGVQYLDGLPITETHFAKDPFHPLSESCIPEIIRRQTDTKTTLVGKKKLPKQFDKGIYIFDAETEEDIAEISLSLRSREELKLIAGCAGFAGVLHRLIDFEKKGLPELDFGENLLLVSGSLNRTSIEQIRLAKVMGYRGVRLTPEQKLDAAFAKSDEGERLVCQICDHLLDGNLAFIEAAESDADQEECERYAASRGMKADPALIADNIGAITKRIIDGGGVENLFVFGGDTLLGIMKKLGVDGIVPLLELCPGVVVSRIVSDKYTFNLISKSGGLGANDVVALATSRLRAFG